MIRLLIYGLLIYVIYRLIKSKGISFSKQMGMDRRPPSSPDETELIQDPQCGAYFLKQSGVAGKSKGQILYFCSRECRDKYMKSHES